MVQVQKGQKLYHSFLWLTILILILEEGLTSSTAHQTPSPHVFNLSGSTSKYAPNQQISDKKQLPRRPELSSKPGVAAEFANQYGVERPSDKTFCWLYDDFEIVQECAKCTKFEISSKTPIACIETGLKETVKCKKSGLVYRSCVAKYVEQKRFWIFECLMLLFATLATGVVKLRWSQLERRAAKQIEKRLASGY